MSFQPRAGMSEGLSAERPRPPSVRARLLRRRRSDPDISRPSGRWRSTAHVSVSLFAIAVARLLLGFFGIGLKWLERPDRSRTRCLIPKRTFALVGAAQGMGRWKENGLSRVEGKGHRPPRLRP